jgi:peptidoglycan hydrolase CwlO-like protein
MLRKILLLLSLSLLLMLISKGQVTKVNLLDSLIKAKQEINQLKKDKADWEKEIKQLKDLLAVHDINDSLRIEIALLRQKITADEDNCFNATKRIKELEEINKKLKKKWWLEAASSVVILATAVYLTFK